MRALLLIVILTFGLCIRGSDVRAVCFEGPVDTFTCNTNAPNPDPTGVQQFGNNNNLTVNVLPGAAINTLLGNGGDAIELSDGADTVTVDNGTVIGEDDSNWQ